MSDNGTVSPLTSVVNKIFLFMKCSSEKQTGLHCLSMHFLQSNSVQNFRTSTVLPIFDEGLDVCVWGGGGGGGGGEFLKKIAHYSLSLKYMLFH